MHTHPPLQTLQSCRWLPARLSRSLVSVAYAQAAPREQSRVETGSERVHFSSGHSCLTCGCHPTPNPHPNPKLNPNSRPDPDPDLQALYTYTDGLRWATQMADGLAYLHDQDPTVIHRDLKLDNILLSGTTLRTVFVACQGHL